VISEFILDEVREKLVEKFKYTSEIADASVKLLGSQMEIVSPIPLDKSVCRDEDDDNILAVAVVGNCECIITGDKDLLVLNQYQDIEILSPSDFQAYESSE
jgi:putative PIN family toxin of toxin-antitoxin system